MYNPSNLLEINSLITDFLQKHELGIITMHRTYFHNDDQLSVRSLQTELVDELKTGCVTFFNKGLPISDLDSYLFYITNAYCKKRASTQVKKKTEYLCPGCLFLKKETLIEPVNKLFKCYDCEDELRHATDPKKITFFRTFFKHNKLGYRCEDCERFIPHPVDDSPTVLCPYFDCAFVGDWSSLRRMHHPSILSNVESITLDSAKDDKISFKDSIASDDASAQTQLEIEEELQSKIKVLRDVIDSQSNSVPYSSSDFTVKHKYLVYQAFSNLLQSAPAEMTDYLLNTSRSGGFQHKIFQEYIKLLEESLPFTFKKNNKFFKVESLLDINLNLFDGISTFDAIVTDKLCVKNETKEFYIGGRKAAYTKPYYIGKLLNVTLKESKVPILDHVIEYSFSKIKLKDVTPGTTVTVNHLRVPPHYQMGGMVYVNRIRKKIVDRANTILEGTK